MGEIKGKVYFYFNIVHFKGASVLYFPKCVVSVCPSSRKYWAANMTSHCKHRLLTSFARLPLPLQSLTEACCLPLYHHFTLRRRRAAIYTAITITVTVWSPCESLRLLFAAIIASRSLVSCIPFAQAAITITLQRRAFY